MKQVQSETSATASAPRVWIFQANPKKYRIEESLKTEPAEYWSVTRYVQEIHDGDRVLIWISGVKAGICAIGTVVGEPVLQTDSPIGIDHWRDRAEGTKIKPRVLVRYDSVFLDCPLATALLGLDPALSELSILISAQGTNFKVKDEEWQAIKPMLHSIAGVSTLATE